MKRIAKANLAELLSAMAAEAKLYVPAESDGIVNFVSWQEGLAVELAALNVLVPPKKFFYPQTETVLKYEMGEDLQIEDFACKAGEKAILFAVRPCDVSSFAMMDKVYLEEPPDEAYRRRRENTTVIALGCTEPDEACFCQSFDIDAAKAPGADVLAVDTGEELALVAQTEKGEELISALNGLLSEATSGDENKVKDEQEKIADRYVTSVSLRGIKERLAGMFAADYWERLYKRCIGCGTCTFLCPTCHCFDLQEYAAGNCGERIRCWDACMFADFTQMAGGHNPRPSQKERVRQRFMHKLNYFPQQHGDYACVGCGRCVRKCPVNLDILEVIREAGGGTDGL
ncbi:MAG: 4Fe-4S dicluster domain-containing protein [Dethiobacter sp.]|nr:4Fe-4S dicluster domain-containing protein [Dethiobacter sp.]MBS3898574.1 4Fe-4S dicluster domain-containing protein [Dethiobacter sp.]MBS3983958.1 4Fe-4S dicluster domain-containing protein [Dethiobacter sp.]MCL4463391.1 4Fe-4S dicluster domain-containing protein [Bacillota bacterium]